MEKKKSFLAIILNARFGVSQETNHHILEVCWLLCDVLDMLLLQEDLEELGR